jgi:hypothetical protein
MFISRKIKEESACGIVVFQGKTIKIKGIIY